MRRAAICCSEWAIQPVAAPIPIQDRRLQTIRSALDRMSLPSERAGGAVRAPVAVGDQEAVADFEKDDVGGQPDGVEAAASKLLAGCSSGSSA